MATLKQSQCLNPKKTSCMNYSALEPVLFEKLQKISCHIQCSELPPSPKSCQQKLHILLQYMHDLKALYSKLVTNTNFDHKSYDVRQHILIYLALLKFCRDELMDCKLKIMQLTTHD